MRFGKIAILRFLVPCAAFAKVVTLPATAQAVVNPSSVFISEFHYDNSGTDSGECIEVSGPAGTNLSAYTILRYNGSGGAVYSSPAGPGPLSGIIPNEGGTGYGAVTFSYPTDGLQNGSLDAIALVSGTTCIESLSYEGSFSAVGGACGGLATTDIGVSESGSQANPISLKRTGAGLQNVDLTWSGPSAGTCNGLLNFTPTSIAITNRTIPEIQGTGAASPFVGTNARTTGVVSAVFPLLGGFYVQDLTGDGNPATSDGIFVLSSSSVTVGNSVTIEARIIEEDDLETALQATLVTVISPGSTAVPATLVAFPITSLEAFEGMKIQVTTSNADLMRIAQNYFVGRYGQLTLSSPEAGGAVGPLITPTQAFDPSTSAGSPIQLLEAAEQAQMLVLDDGQDVDPDGDNPNLVPYLGCQDSPPLPPTRTLRAGDFAGNLVGIIDQGQIGTPSGPASDYRLQPLATSSITFTTGNPRPTSPPNAAAPYKIVGYNINNYFTTLRANNSNARGSFDGVELSCQTSKLVQALCKLNADVVGAAELENNLAAISMLVNGGTSAATSSVPAQPIAGLNAACGPYAAITGPTVDVIGTDQIKVGIIYKPSTTTPVGAPMILPASVGGQSSYPNFNRPSLAQTFKQNSTGTTFTVVVNHWKSKGSDCDANNIPPADVDTGDLAGECNLTRKGMAQAVVNWVNSTVIPTSGNSNVLLVGDFNAYAKEDPIDVLAANGWVSLLARDEGVSSQDYIFNGRAGNLSGGFAQPEFATKLKAATWRINSDEPLVTNYENFFNQAGCRDFCSNEFRSSDHDPVSFALTTSTVPTVPATSNGSWLLASVLLGLVGLLGAGALARRKQLA